MDAGDGGSEGENKNSADGGEPKVKRKMKTAFQLDILEKTYAVEPYPSGQLRADLSVKLSLTDRQLQMWFCHRRLKDRKTPPQVKRSKKEISDSGGGSRAGDDMVVVSRERLGGNEHGGPGGSGGSGSGSSPFGHSDQVVSRAIPIISGSGRENLQSIHVILLRTGIHRSSFAIGICVHGLYRVDGSY